MDMSPCKDCDRRYVGCHGSCEDYIAFADRKRKENDRIKQEKKRYVTQSWSYSQNKKYTKLLKSNRNFSV